MLEEEIKTDIIFLPDSNPFNVPYSEWTVRWWRWLDSIKKRKSPARDKIGWHCSESQHDANVWYLAGTSAPGMKVKRKCKIPYGKALFFPLITSIFSFPADRDLKSVEDVIRKVTEDIDTVNTDLLELTIDGMTIKDLNRFRFRSEPFDDAIDGLKTSTVSDGYWIFLKPPKSGHHLIHFKARNHDFFNEVTYKISINATKLN